MPSREMLDPDVKLVHEQVDNVLNSRDSLIVLLDGTRAISYARGFGLSACQLELLAADIERLIRDVIPTAATHAVDELAVSLAVSDPPLPNHRAGLEPICR